MVRVDRNHEPGPRRRIDHSAGGTHVHGACRERGKAASGSIKVLTLEVLWVRVAPYMGVVRRRFAGRERARCTTPARGMGCGDQEKPVGSHAIGKIVELVEVMGVAIETHQLQAERCVRRYRVTELSGR